MEFAAMAEPITPRPMMPNVFFKSEPSGRNGDSHHLKSQTPARGGGRSEERHFFFLAFFAGFLFAEDLCFERKDKGFELTSTTAMMHGSLPRTLQECMVPRWMKTSPAFSSVSPFSITA